MLQTGTLDQLIVDFNRFAEVRKPQRILDVRPVLYGVPGSTLRKQVRNRWNYLKVLKQKNPLKYTADLRKAAHRQEKINPIQDHQDTEWAYLQDLSSRNPTWSAVRSASKESADTTSDDDENSEEDNSTVDEEQEENIMSFSSPSRHLSRSSKKPTMRSPGRHSQYDFSSIDEARAFGK
jgi:hypothetical protein